MKRLLQALLTGLLFLVFCGFAYPLLALGIGQSFLPGQSNGSMVTVGGRVVGSALIGQDFKDARFFHGRVSAVHYNTFPAGTNESDLIAVSGSANYAVSNPELKKRIQTDVAAFLKANPGMSEKDLPADLFTSSFSGLDPDISPAAAAAQANRIAKAAGIDRAKVGQIINDNTAGRALGVFGEPRVNVLEANLEIYKLIKGK